MSLFQGSKKPEPCSPRQQVPIPYSPTPYGQGAYNQCPATPCEPYPDPDRTPLTPCLECGALMTAPCYHNYPGSQRQPSCLQAPSEGAPNPPNTPQNSEKPQDQVEVCGEKKEDDKEVFVLRIGKKKEGSDKNPKLELEMTTPKGKELKPIPRKETRETQYDPGDVAQETKGKKGKGKDKGKGKGKGKKK